MHLRLYHNTSCLLCLLILVTLNSVAVSASITEYILNGNNAPATPHHTHIRIRPLAQTPNGDAYVGSGSLISSMHVLTCAQNIYGFHSFEAGLGSSNRYELKFFECREGKVHPDYDPVTLNNNIGIIYLKQAIDYTDTIRPISMVAPNTVLPFPLEQGTITGFGLTHGNVNRFPSQLQQGYQRVVMATECNWRYPHLANISTTTHFCGIDDNRDSPTNICSGDQGAAFAVMLRGIQTLVGIASFTERNCVPELGAVYVRVTTYRRWISNETGV